MPRSAHPAALWALGIACHVSSVASQSSTLSSKRGLAYLGDDHQSDLNLLLSPNSSLDWYYNWSPNIVADITLPFVPLLHGLDDASSSDVLSTINSLPASSTHLLTFNEPDGTTSSGGSSISPSDAAKAYINDIVPLRSSSSSRKWNISHPATTGSSTGLAWLQEFNASCWAIDPDNGCPTDFVALHWYGDFAGLASWLGTLYEFYVTNASSGATVSTGLPFWITEMALPQEDEDTTLAMLNQSVAYLDGLDYVQAYAWYGVDRKASSWDGYTGGNVAVFNKEGALTDVGALYLGGQQEGFKEGMTGGAVGLRGSATVTAATVVAVLTVLLFI